MPIGHPDFASVRRHFFGRTVDTQAFTLGAYEFQGFAYPESELDDVVAIRIYAGAGVKVQIHSYGVAGDYAQTWDLGLTVEWGAGRRIIVQPMGGGIDVLVQDTTGVAGATVNFQVDTYIGADQNMLAIDHAKMGQTNQVLNSGAFSFPLVLPEACIYDVVDLWGRVSPATGRIDATIVENGDGTAGSMYAYSNHVITLSAVQVFQASIPTAGIGMYFSMTNTGAAPLVATWGYRAHRLS